MHSIIFLSLAFCTNLLPYRLKPTLRNILLLIVIAIFVTLAYIYITFGDITLSNCAVVLLFYICSMKLSFSYSQEYKETKTVDKARSNC